MILDILENAEAYYNTHPLFKKAFAFLKANDFAAYEPGEYEIKGRDVFAIVAHAEGRGKDASPLEAHRTYIDIQYCFEGTDIIGWTALQDCKSVSSAYDTEKDICFFDDAVVTWCELPRGTFAVLFPHDGHAPLAGKDACKKVIIKVKA